MKGRWKKSLLAVWICLFVTMVFTAHAEETGESGALEVYLKSLGTVSTLDITVKGSYSFNANTDFRLAEGATIRASAQQGDVWLDCGALSINMGASVTLTRHEKSGQNGLLIEGSPRGKLYAGSLRLSASENELRAVLIIDIDDYLYGVVPYEMSNSFPMEALKAQAVAARTYALKRREDRGGRDYDVVDTTADQVFMGYDEQYVNAIAAVDATKGIVGLYQGHYATCYYTASNGGQTAMAHDILGTTSDDGYLAIVDDPYDLENTSSPVTSLTLRADAYDLPEALRSFMKASVSGTLAERGYSDSAEDIFIDEITSVEPHTTKAGEPNRMYQYLRLSFHVSACPIETRYTEPTNIDRIHALFGNDTFVPEFLGVDVGEPVLLEDTFQCDLTIYEFLKDELNLKISAIDCELCTVREEQGQECREFVVEMRRFGHGVGMSQRGAQQMAGVHQKTFMDILSFYYPGLTFETRTFRRKTLPAMDQPSAGAAPASQYTGADVQSELPALSEGERYATVTLSTDSSTLNVRSAPSTDGQILAALKNGWRVIVVEELDGWAHVRTADVEGYVSLQYLN